MIIANASTKEKTRLLLGLSYENVRRLADGYPILVNRDRHGEQVPEDLEICIAYGKTEDDLVDQLVEGGLVRRENVVDEREPID